MARIGQIGGEDWQDRNDDWRDCGGASETKGVIGGGICRSVMVEFVR